jgi:flagellar protein FliS
MMFQQAVEVYRNVAVETAHPLKLVIMAYQGAVAALDRAISALEQRDYRRKSEEIQKAVALVSELLAALDVERGGQLAKSLSSLYAYFLKRLFFGDVRKDMEALMEVRAHLAGLQESWEKMCWSSARQPPGRELGSRPSLRGIRP